MNIKKIVITMFALILAFVVVGCSKEIVRTSEDFTPVDTQVQSGDSVAPPDIIGEILDYQTSDAIRVLINSTDGDVKGEIWVTINEDTVFLEDTSGKELENVDVTTFFVVGETVGILSNGMIMESYPMQTTALQVYQKVD